MKVEITGDPKEIAALVLAVQERQSENTPCGKRIVSYDGTDDVVRTARSLK